MQELLKIFASNKYFKQSDNSLAMFYYLGIYLFRDTFCRFIIDVETKSRIYSFLKRLRKFQAFLLN